MIFPQVVKAVSLYRGCLHGTTIENMGRHEIDGVAVKKEVRSSSMYP